MIAMLVSRKGLMVSGETIVTEAEYTRAMWENIIARYREAANANGAIEIQICAGDATEDARGDLAHRVNPEWHTVYHEREGKVLLDRLPV